MYDHEPSDMPEGIQCYGGGDPECGEGQHGHQPCGDRYTYRDGDRAYAR